MNALAKTDREQTTGLVSVDGRTYPLKSASINARAEGGIAATTLSQSYENPYAEALEVHYTLPLPADGAVTGYTIRLGKRVIRGEVRRREEAREEYRKALFEGRTAALLEQERADTFSQKLGSLPPGEAATIEIEVLQPLAFLPGAGGERACWEYRFPTVVGVRYEGAENRVPDAAKLDVDRASDGTPVRLEANVQIADGLAEEILPCSPDQQISIHADGNSTKVSLDKGMALDRDLVIRWFAVKQETGVHVFEGIGLPCDSGRYLLITLTPPAAASEAVARDLTLLIDASGSMSGEPLEQAKTVAMEILRSLDPGDRFEILAFSDQAWPLIAGPVEAGEENIGRAGKELRKLRSSGSTEMTNALIKALKPLRPDSQRQVILLSDGYIGFEREVIGEVWHRLVPGARVHVVGVGSAPNRTLTRGVARAGRGIEIIIGLEDDARQAAGRLLQATVRPVLTDIRIQGSALLSYAPQKPRDVFAGQPALIFAEVEAEGGQMEIRGRMAGKSTDWIESFEIPRMPHFAREIPARDPNATAIPIGALLGREAIEDAEINLAACGDSQQNEIERKIESLGLRHGISSRMTSLIAISEVPTVDPRDPRRRERLPVEVPAGLSAEGVGLLAGASWGPVGESMTFYGSATRLRSRPPFKSRFSLGLDFFRTVREPISGRKMGSPLGPITIEKARVLHIDDRILVFEFEAPLDDFVLPADDTKIIVLFDQGGKTCIARVLKDDSSKPGPHPAGVTIRLALQLEGNENWSHKSAEIHWCSQLNAGKTEIDVDVTVRIMLERDL
jgi:Ca-activated chloride channel family protein